MSRTISLFCAAVLLLLSLSAPAQPPPPMADYNQAWRVAIQGRFDQALPLLGAIIDRDPSFWRAHKLIADTALYFGKLSEAESFFQSLARRRPPDPYPWYGLAQVALSRGAHLAAAAHLRECIRRAPDACACYDDLSIALSNGKNGSAGIAGEDVARLVPEAAASPCLGVAMASAHTWRFEYPQAIEVAERGLEAARQAGNTDLMMGYAFVLRGAYEGQGNIPRSFEYSRLQVELAEALGDEGAALHYSAYRERQEELAGNLEAAVQLSQAHAARARELNAPLLLAGCLDALAHRLEATGDLQGAIAAEQEGVEQQRRIADPAGAANALGRISQRYLALGLVDEGVEAARQSVQELAGTGPARLGTLAFSHRSLSDAYRARGDYFLALQEAERSVSIFQQLGMNWQAGAGIGRIGELYAHLGDLEKAFRYTRAALDAAVAHADPGEQQIRLAILGDLALKSGRSLEAANHFRRARALSARARLPDFDAYALLGLGRAQTLQRRHAAAEGSLHQALAAFRSLGLRVKEGEAAVALGSLALRRGRPAEAEGHFRAALELAETVQSPELSLAAHRSLADTAARRGELALALRHSEAALTQAETLRAFRPDLDYRAAFLEQNWRLYGDAIHLLWRLHRRDPAAGYDRRAFEISERARARSLLETLAGSRVSVHKGLSPEQVRRQADLFAALSRAADGLLQKPGADGRRRYDESLRRVSAWVAELRAAGSELADLQYPQPVSLADLQKAFSAPGTALLQHAVGDQASFLWVVGGGRARMFLLPARAALEEAVRDYRKLLAHPPQGGEALSLWRRQAATVYGLVLAPAAPFLRNARRLVIVPDGILHYLPFETLAAGDATPPVIENWTIAYAPSASVYLQLRNRGPAGGPGRRELLAYGDPVFPREKSAAGETPALARLVRAVYDGAGLNLRRLPNTGEEVRGIGSLFPAAQRKLVLRDLATEEAFKREDLSAFKRIHFATHAILDERTPSRSGVVLSPGRGGREDGVLRLNEIFNLRLDSDLVVLSACQTGLGRMVRGEGIVGLTRGFLYAGAPRVVVSLWEVNDMAAPVLMRKFYAGLSSGAAPAAALRDAKLAMLRGPAPLYTHPYYWAPFVAIGPE